MPKYSYQQIANMLEAYRSLNSSYESITQGVMLGNEPEKGREFLKAMQVFKQRVSNQTLFLLDKEHTLKLRRLEEMCQALQITSER